MVWDCGTNGGVGLWVCWKKWHCGEGSGIEEGREGSLGGMGLWVGSEWGIWSGIEGVWVGVSLDVWEWQGVG